MSGEDSAAAENVRCLEQGIELIGRLDDDLFAAGFGVAPSTLRHWKASSPTAAR